ncbi:MAG: hypothetical protein R6V72_10985 [Cyclobacterium sp.]
MKTKIYSYVSGNKADAIQTINRRYENKQIPYLLNRKTLSKLRALKGFFQLCFLFPSSPKENKTG